MGAFWIKRVFRLLPLAWFWLMIAALYAFAIAHIPGAKEQEGFFLAPILAASLHIANLYTPYCNSSGANPLFCDVSNITGHYWSLSLEEQFYMLYPFLFFLVNRKVLVAVLCFAIIAQLFWARPFGSYAWHFRTDALSWGVLLGFFSTTRVYAKSARRLLHYRYLLTALMYLLILLLPVISRELQGGGAQAKPYGVATIAFVSGIIVLIASYDFKCIGNTGVYNKIMLYLGARSYSIYVTHLILFMIIAAVAGRSEFKMISGESMVSDISYSTLSLLVVLAASELSYRYIEKRYRPRGPHMARQLLKGRGD